MLKRKNFYGKRDVIKYLKQPNEIKSTTLIKPFKIPSNTNQISDKEGLERAYGQANHIYINDNTMYIAGSKSIQDWVDNFMYIPSRLGTWHNIYKSAEEQLLNNPTVINEAIGHSAGGYAALELKKNYPQIEKTRTYGAPVAGVFGNSSQINDDNLRFKTTGDPVSILDSNAITVPGGLNILKNHYYGTDKYGSTGLDTGKQIM